MLLYPGKDIPEEWLGPQCGDPPFPDNTPLAAGQKPHYPALVFSNPWIADHHPLQISISSTGDYHAPRHQVLKINHLEAEDWVIKNDQFQQFCTENWSKIANSVRNKNPLTLLTLIHRGLQKTFKDCQRKSKETQPAPERSPFHQFCRRRRHHPDYPILISAVQQMDMQQASRIMTGMSRDGWRDHLSKTHPSDISAFFRYLAKEDGRKPRQCLHSCSAPLKDPTGTRHFGTKKKCALLAEFLEAKLAAPYPHGVATTKPPIQGKRANRAPATRPPKKIPHSASMYKMKDESEFLPFSEMEVYRAVQLGRMDSLQKYISNVQAHYNP